MFISLVSLPSSSSPPPLSSCSTMATTRDDGALPPPPGGSAPHASPAAAAPHQQHRAERASKARGEVAELRAALASFSATGRTATDGGAAKREVFKKLVHYMTIGIDMSGLFMQVREERREGRREKRVKREGERERERDRDNQPIDRSMALEFPHLTPLPRIPSLPPSRAFLSQVIAAAAPSSDDVLLKKMLYWYVATYARANPELTLLTINLLTKDCSLSSSPDPAVRALALRALCGLRVRNLVEYAAPAVTRALKDPHPTVRRAAVVGVLKVLHVDPAAASSAGWLPTLERMLPPAAEEPDPGVAANALAVLRAAGRLPRPLPRAMIVPLLNRIRDFSEWGQCLLMEVAAGGGVSSAANGESNDGGDPSPPSPATAAKNSSGGFVPRDDAEAFALLEVLDDRLGSSNSAVVLAAAKLFLHLTLGMPETHQRVLERLRGALLLVAGGESPETAAAALAHLRLLAERAPPLFAPAAQALYPRRSDPPCVRAAKLATLVAVADESNVHDIASELAAEALDASDPPAARAAVAALGGVAAAVPGAPGVAERLLGIVEALAAAAATAGHSAAPTAGTSASDSGGDSVLAEAIVQAAALARRAPGAAAVVVAALAGSGGSSEDGGGGGAGSSLSRLSLLPSDVDDAAGRAAYVWLLGEHGAHLKATPYALEELADGWKRQPREVRSALLRAAVRLFFNDSSSSSPSPSSRAAEVAPLLRKVLAAGAADGDARVRDSALLYARAFGGGGVSAAAALAEAASCPPAPPPDGGRWPEDAPEDVADVVFAEFNTLAVLYRSPMANLSGAGGGDPSSSPSSAATAAKPPPLPSLLDDSETSTAAATTTTAAASSLLVADLLDVSDDVASSAAAVLGGEFIDQGSSLLSVGGQEGEAAGGAGGGGGLDLGALAAALPSPSSSSSFAAPVLSPTSSVDPFADPFASASAAAPAAAVAASTDPFDLLRRASSSAPVAAAPPAGAGAGDDPFGLGDLVAALSSSPTVSSSQRQQLQPL